MFNVPMSIECDTMASLGERMPTENTPLAEYILDLLEKQNMSMREGSMRAGLAPETISQVIRRGRTNTPRPDTLRLIATALGGSYRKMMVLAGHLEPQPGIGGMDPEIQEIVEELIDRWDSIARRDPSGESLRQLLTIVTTQAAAFEAAMAAAERHAREERESPPNAEHRR